LISRIAAGNDPVKRDARQIKISFAYYYSSLKPGLINFYRFPSRKIFIYFPLTGTFVRFIMLLEHLFCFKFLGEAIIMFKGLTKKDVVQSFFGAGCMAAVVYAYSVLLVIVLK
jgi:Trk-type K+ transport system membrane component